MCLHLQTQISKYVISASATSTTLAVATIADYDFKVRSEITGETLSAPFAPAAVRHGCWSAFSMVDLQTRTAHTGHCLLFSVGSAVLNFEPARLPSFLPQIGASNSR